MPIPPGPGIRSLLQEVGTICLAGGPGCGLRSQETPLYSPAQVLSLKLRGPAGERGWVPFGSGTLGLLLLHLTPGLSRPTEHPTSYPCPCPALPTPSPDPRDIQLSYTRTHWSLDPARLSLPAAQLSVVLRLGPSVLSGTVSGGRGRPASYDPLSFSTADMGSLWSWWTLWAGATLLWGK